MSYSKIKGKIPGACLLSIQVRAQIKMLKYFTKRINTPKLADCDAKLACYKKEQQDHFDLISVYHKTNCLDFK